MGYLSPETIEPEVEEPEVEESENQAVANTNKNSKDDIIKYVMHSPHNTNAAILEQMLDNFGINTEGLFIINGTIIHGPTEPQITFDKTFEEIDLAFQQDKFPVILGKEIWIDEFNEIVEWPYVFVQSGCTGDSFEFTSIEDIYNNQLFAAYLIWTSDNNYIIKQKMYNESIKINLLDNNTYQINAGNGTYEDLSAGQIVFDNSDTIFGKILPNSSSYYTLEMITDDNIYLYSDGTWAMEEK